MLALALLVVAFAIVRPHGSPGPAMRDFEAYYAAGLTANLGGDPYGRRIWDAERRIPGVDATHDETLPFVGPAAGLPLWQALARLPYAVAGRIWGAILAFSMLAMVFGSLALAGAPRRASALLGGALLAGSFGPLTSDVALGQVALLSAAGVVIALLLLRTRAWPAAAIGALFAALQPNLAIVLAARASDLRAACAFSLGFAIFAAIELGNGGLHGLWNYLVLLRAHGEAEANLAIQIGPGPVALGFGANLATAAAVRYAAAAAAALALFVASRRIRAPEGRVALLACALPFLLPFFHEHDFVIVLLPAIACAVRARGRVLAFAAVAATASGVDWLGLAQRPDGALQSTALAIVTALGFVLLAGLQREAWAALAVPCGVLAAAGLVHGHPVPIWPDSLPAGWHPPDGAGIAQVWGLEERLTGLAAPSAAWSFLRSCSLASSAALGIALALTLKRIGEETSLRYRRS